MPDTIPLSRLVEQLRDQQCHDWECDQCTPVETYLDQHAELRAEVDSALMLIYQEILLRERRGEKPQLNEYVARFPHLAERLERLFSVHGAFEASKLLVPEDSQHADTFVGKAEPTEVRPPIIPGFEMLEELGRGGVGVVYKARQKNLNRVVALKLLLAGVHASPEELKRFQREAEAQAQLQHSHIVQIHEVGATTLEGSGLAVHYLAMEFLAGGSLAHHLAGKTLPAHAAANLIETLARAMHYAHQQGLVHRDLKPGNILLALSGEPKATTRAGAVASLNDLVPKIADFGLVKCFQQDSPTSTSGQIVGTPSYMAPEQAAGRTHAITPATDVYALGAILYETLTGRPPFVGESAISTLMQVQYHDPVPVRKLHPRVARDLETICLKCLRKDPAKRYTDAAALADDLRRFQDGRPILARPTPLAERLLRWCGRNPLPAAALAVVVLTVAAAFTLIASAWQQEQTAAQNAREKQKEAELKNAHLTFQRALALCEQGKVSHGMLWLARSLGLADAVGDDDLQRVVRTNLGGWFRQLHTLQSCKTHGAGVLGMACSLDGNMIAVVGRDQHIRIYDAALQKVVRELHGGSNIVRAVAISPDGTKLAAGMDNSTARLWELTTGQLLDPPLQHDGPVNSVAFSRDSALLLTGSADHTAKLWTVAERELLHTLPHGGNVFSAAFHPEKPLVATGSPNFEVHLWNVQTGEQLTRKKPKGEFRHPQAVNAIAFHPKGHMLVTACHDGSVYFWDVDNRIKYPKQLTHRQIVRSVAYSPDGKRLVTGYADGTAQIWDEETATPIGGPLEHDGWVTSVAFHAAGTQVVTGSRDGPVRLWDVSGVGKETRTLRLAKAETVDAAAFSPDGLQVAAAVRPANLGVQIWNAHEGQKIRERHMMNPRRMHALVFSPDGKWILGGGPAENSAAQPPKAGPPPGCVAWWEVNGPGHAAKKVEKLIRTVAVSPDNTTFVAGGSGATIHVWRVTDEKHLELRLPHEEGIWAATFAGDGTLLTGDGRSSRGSVRFWDLKSGKEARDSLPHDSAVISLGFTKDGKTLFTACQNGTVRFWEAATLQRKLKPLRDTGALRCAAISPAGDMILTDSHAYSARLWDVATGLPLGPPLRHANLVVGVSFNRDGDRMLTAGWDGVARVWPVPKPWSSPAAEVRQHVESATGLKLDDDDGVHTLDAAAWQALQK